MADGSSWTNYSEYNKTVRAWFVAFGIGGPLAILANPTLLDALKTVGLAKCVVTAFLIAVGLQILIAVINKTISLQLAWGEDDEDYQKTKIYEAAEKITGWWFLDAGVDLISIVMFGYALCTLAYVGLSLPPGALPVKH